MPVLAFDCDEDSLSMHKPVSRKILSWCLAVICEPPSDSGGSVGYLGLGRLAAESFPLGDSCYNSGTLKLVRLAVRVVPLGGIAAWGFLRRLTLGSTCHPLGSLEAAMPSGMCPPPGDFDAAALSCWILHA
ncbi:hypothetical protein DEO72_LG4g487 [Vigna unguiculata]|uniref:Uncharacterized protein n=1 Tax=Vigna unguiculata TaxID=3917 RepID=A0A4D6LLS1_VIGUN|nr:hypothetical protein DEO72_LG4g487 [Vigna unguiculata]